MNRYEHMTRPELQSLRNRFIVALAQPRVSNRAQVEGYLANVEAALVTATAQEMATAPSIHEMRTGKRAPRNDADRERMSWSFYS